MRRLWSAATKATVTLFLPDANKNSRIPKKLSVFHMVFPSPGDGSLRFSLPGNREALTDRPVPMKRPFLRLSSVAPSAAGSLSNAAADRFDRRPFVRICGPRAPSVGNARAARSVPRSGPSGAHLPRLFPGRDRAEPRPALLRKTHLFRRRERRPCDFAPQKTEKKFFLPMTMQKSC